MKTTLVLAVVALASSTAKADPLRDDCLAAHNAVRALHQDTPALTYDASLAASAQSVADNLALRDLFQPSVAAHVGENIYRQGEGCVATIYSAVFTWYSQSTGDPSYDYTRGDDNPGMDQFTQVVWKDTASVGCGVSDLGSKTIIVAHYSPPGNEAGQYAEQVLELKDGAVPPSSSKDIVAPLVPPGDGPACNECDWTEGGDAECTEEDQPVTCAADELCEVRYKCRKQGAEGRGLIQRQCVKARRCDAVDVAYVKTKTVKGIEQYVAHKCCADDSCSENSVPELHLLVNEHCDEV